MWNTEYWHLLSSIKYKREWWCLQLELSNFPDNCSFRNIVYIYLFICFFVCLFILMENCLNCQIYIAWVESIKHIDSFRQHSLSLYSDGITVLQVRVCCFKNMYPQNSQASRHKRYYGNRVGRDELGSFLPVTLDWSFNE